MSMTFLLVAYLSSFAAGAKATGAHVPPSKSVEQLAKQRAGGYADRLEQYLRHWLVDAYPERAADAWHRDYSDIRVYLASIEPNRRQWRALLNPPALKPTGPAQTRPFAALADVNGQWISVPLGGFDAEGILAVPDGAADKPVPVVIAPHGLGGFPEAVFGLAQNAYYHGYGRRLVEEGFAVLAPAAACGKESRNRLERMCRLGGMTLSGIELTRLQRLLDVVLADPRIDAERVGIWGLSLGGRATMYWTPLEPRIRVAVVSGWFNRRPEKMVVPSDRYSCFLETDEEHAFYYGWLTAFSDDDVISMICPRPVMIQTGKKDPISHWPDVLDEFEKARKHYEKLGLADRIEMNLHEGGHEVVVDTGVRFLKRWLAGRAP